ncbi:MAG: DUF4199 domain-containing protein [Cyclobacteriaceae bacterium]
MKKIILINGGIAGAIVSVLMLITHPLVENGTINYDNGMLVGYATMVLALSMVFVGIKTYRDQVLKGVISFGQACKVGLLITLIASVMYAITWDIYYRVSASDFMEKYATHYVEKMKNEGASDEEISSMRTEMEDLGRLYKNTFIRFGMTLMEILPVGIVITLLSAAILRKRLINFGN